MHEDLLLEYQLLQSDSPKELSEFFSARPLTSTESKLKVILHDLQSRWKSNRPMKVEEYLEQFPELANDPDVVVAMVKTEQKAQHGIDTIPEISALVQRFPHLACRFLDQLRTIDSKSQEQSDVSFHATLGVAEAAKGEILASRYRMLRQIGQGAFGSVHILEAANRTD